MQFKNDRKQEKQERQKIFILLAIWRKVMEMKPATDNFLLRFLPNQYANIYKYKIKVCEYMTIDK